MGRPGSAMSECSIQLPGDVSRPGSRMDQMLGDELSRSLLDLTTSGNLHASPAHNASYSSGFPQGKNMLDDLDVEINLGEMRPPKERRKKKQAEKQQRQWQKRFEPTLKFDLKRKKRKEKKLRQQRRKRRPLPKLKSSSLKKKLKQKREKKRRRQMKRRWQIWQRNGG